MSSIDSILRRTGYIDSSGSYPAPAIQATIQQSMGGGVYATNGDTAGQNNVLSGQISLGFIGALVVVAVAFYLWTHNIQGGG